MAQAGGAFAAGGSVRADRALPLAPRTRLRLLVEMAVLYICTPLAIDWLIHTYRLPLVWLLQPVLLAIVIYLLWDRTFLMRRELSQGFRWRVTGQIVGTFLAVGGAITVATAVLMPDRFLGFPRYRPELWLMVMVLYPLLSVIAQELVYRTFFFHRYGGLLGGFSIPVVAALNGVLFGVGHVMFGNWIAIAGTAGIGALLAYRYMRTRSFWAVWVEHSLFGCLVFTVGLGQYFFTGVSNLR